MWLTLKCNLCSRYSLLNTNQQIEDSWNVFQTIMIISFAYWTNYFWMSHIQLFDFDWSQTYICIFVFAFLFPRFANSRLFATRATLYVSLIFFKRCFLAEFKNLWITNCVTLKIWVTSLKSTVYLVLCASRRENILLPY